MKDESKGRLILALTTIAAAVSTGLIVFWPRKKTETASSTPPPIVPVSSLNPVYYADFTPGIFTRKLKVGEILEVAMPPGQTYHVLDFLGEGTIVAGAQGLTRFDSSTGYLYAKYIALKPGVVIAMITTEGEPGVSMTLTITVTP